MLIQQKAGTLRTIPVNDRVIDRLPLEWYETNKRILRKRSLAGTELALKFLGEHPRLLQDDVLYHDAQTIIAVDIIPCEVLVVTPRSMYEMASVCYEIGNKHLPLFYEADALLVPYEDPLFRLLTAGGYAPVREIKKLLQPLNTSVTPHDTSGSTSLFSKILQLTTTTTHV